MTDKKKKQIIESILTEEIKKNNLDIKFSLEYRIRYYSKEFFNNLKNKSLKLYKPSKQKYNTAGFYRQTGEIVIFLDKTGILVGTLNSLVSLIFTTYHELSHSIQKKEYLNPPEEISYNLFSCFCSYVLTQAIPEYIELYQNSVEFHDEQMHEIFADIYALKKTKEYLKLNEELGISLKEYLLGDVPYDEYLEEKERDIFFRYSCYNLTKTLDRMLEYYGVYFTLGEDCKIKIIFELFLNEDGSFKDINEIFADENVLKLDSRIVMAFVRTNKMLEAIKNTQLTEKTINVLTEISMNYSNRKKDGRTIKKR